MDDLRDLDTDVGAFAEGLNKALSFAAPAPVSWGYARQCYAQGRWQLIKSDGAAALIAHGAVAGHKTTSILAMSGELSACPDLVKIIEAKAVEAGSDFVVYMGRRGWVREFPDYVERAVFGVKEL